MRVPGDGARRQGAATPPLDDLVPEHVHDLHGRLMAVPGEAAVFCVDRRAQKGRAEYTERRSLKITTRERDA
jgi:hypothetical protein